MVLPKTASMPEMELEWKIPEKSNAIERDRARSYHQAYSALVGLHCLEKALVEIRAGRTKSWNNFKVPEEAVSVGFHEAARGVLSHHMVIRDGKIANYQPYPPTPWNANPRDVYGTPGPVRGRRPEHADLRGERPRELQGHRHHAGGALVRPVPAVRRAHVHRGRARAEGGAPPDRALLMSERHRDDPMERVSELTAAPRGDRRRPMRARLAEELVGAMVELYGEGLARIMDVARRRFPAAGELRGRLAADGVVASLLLDPRPLPGAARGARARRRSPRVRPYMESHGGDVELLGHRRGASRSCAWSATATAARRRLQTLELAITEALEEAAPDLLGVEVEGLAEPAQPAAGGVTAIRGRLAAPTWLPRRGGGRRRARRGRDGHAARRRARGRERRGHAARLPQRVPVLRRRSRRRGPRGRDPDLRQVPARATSSRAPAARSGPTTSSSSRCRCCGGRRRGRRGGRHVSAGLPPSAPNPEVVTACAGWRGRARRTSRPRPRRPARAATCAARRSTRSTATCCSSSSTASCARASRASRMRAGDPDLRPTGTRVAVLERLRPLRRALGRVPDPDRPRVLLPQRAAGGVVAFYPSPAGATESRALPRGLGRARRREPRARRPRAGGRGADRQPPERAAQLRDRADRPLLRARRRDQGELGGHLGRARGRGRRRRVLRRACASAGASRERGPGARVHGPRGVVRRGRRRADAALRPRRERERRPRGVHDRAHGADQHRPGAAQLRRRDARAPRRPLRRAGALGGDDAQLPLGATRARSCRASPARRRSRSRRVHVRPRGGRDQVLRRPARRRRPAHASTSTARSSPRRRRRHPGGRDPVVVLGALAHAGRRRGGG